MTALAAVLRLPGLGRPAELVFDETYYVKDAWTLLQLGYEAEWGEEPDLAFEAGDTSGYTTEPSYVVHPPIGKWLIAIGLRLAGADTAAGWRVSSAVAGILAVLLLTRITRRLTGSTAAGAAAGALMAIDGLAIVHSRTALLDGILATLLLAAFAALLLDRDRARARLAAATRPPWAPTRFGPHLGVRGWRVVGGVLLGLALGTKWSALWFVAAFGLLTVGWDAAARHRAGVRRWWQGALLRDAAPAFVSIVPVSAAVYLAGWWSWFASPSAYGRTWAVDHPGEGVGWLPEALRSLWHYHQQVWSFHTTLTTEHTYQASPFGWLVQARPTAFFWVSPEPAEQVCGADRCAQTVTSVGNPLIWWLGSLALVVCLAWAVRRRDGVAAVVLTGVGAGWLPWFAFLERTAYTFYAIVILPWLVIGLTWVGLRLVRDGPWWWRPLLVVLAIVVAAVSVFFYPVWTAMVIPFRAWQLHMWLPSWV